MLDCWREGTWRRNKRKKKAILNCLLVVLSNLRFQLSCICNGLNYFLSSFQFSRAWVIFFNSIFDNLTRRIEDFRKSYVVLFYVFVTSFFSYPVTLRLSLSVELFPLRRKHLSLIIAEYKETWAERILPWKVGGRCLSLSLKILNWFGYDMRKTNKKLKKIFSDLLSRECPKKAEK